VEVCNEMRLCMNVKFGLSKGGVLEVGEMGDRMIFACGRDY